ncbi:MAG: hypothetical protein IPP83_10885 [Flavobacteriales bacterium]|nr:hypothetical protein [Flavobacteriales bacterium]
MKTLDVNRFGMAAGVTAGLLYLGCTLVMLIAGHAGTTYLFNSLLHGLDVSGIVRMEMSMWQTCTGFLATLVLGWLTGACVAWIYNMGQRRGSAKAN